MSVRVVMILFVLRTNYLPSLHSTSEHLIKTQYSVPHSGIDIRSETGVMKPLFGGGRVGVDERNELARLRLYVKQLETRVDSGVSSSYEDDVKVENLQKVGVLEECIFGIFREISATLLETRPEQNFVCSELRAIISNPSTNFKSPALTLTLTPHMTLPLSRKTLSCWKRRLR